VGARALQERLTRRLFALTALVLAAVGFGAVVLTDRSLEASDRGSASAEANSRLSALETELGEGDQLDEALREVKGDAEASGSRLVIWTGGRTSATAGGEMLLTLRGTAACRTVTDERGRPWCACVASRGQATVAAAIPVGKHRETVAALLRGMLGVVGIGLIALWLAVRQALREPLAELRSLVDWTERLIGAEQAIPPPPARTTEITSLEHAFDTLVRRLLDALARARANSAHIAHELRTPLTAILAELDALEKGSGGPSPAGFLSGRGPSAAGPVARIRGDVARLADVIEALLVLSDPSERKRPSAIVNLADMAREMAPAGAGVEAPDEALIEADERLVALALRNLLENAHRYGAGAKALRLSHEGERVRLAVIDEGPGLDAEARARMFDRYWRGSADGHGRGLGLALVLAVAERYGGLAEAAPGKDGRGLEVSMTFDGLVRWSEPR
jgi:two-component system sensor histidine kinase QseC